MAARASYEISQGARKFGAGAGDAGDAAEASAEAAKKKLNLICEKPLALNHGDAIRLYEVAKEEGVALTAVQNYNFQTVKNGHTV